MEEDEETLYHLETSLAVHWLELCAYIAGGSARVGRWV